MTTTTHRIPREILKDRWTGAMWASMEGPEPSELAHRLKDALMDAAWDVARCHGDDITEAGIIDELIETIHETLVRRIDEKEIARAGVPI